MVRIRRERQERCSERFEENKDKEKFRKFTEFARRADMEKFWQIDKAKGSRVEERRTSRARKWRKR